MMRHNPKAFLPLFAFMVLAFVVLVLPTPAPVIANEASTAQRFERAKASEPQLIAFLKEMPKGADLHNHVSGAVYAETYLDAAIHRNWYFDPKTSRFTSNTSNQRPESVPASDLLINARLASQFLDLASMRGCPAAVARGHDHFFATFDCFRGLADAVGGEAMLAEVISRAKAQNLQYLELMPGAALGDAIEAARPAPPATLDDMEKAFLQMQKGFAPLLTTTQALLDQWDSGLARLVGVQDPITGVGGPINVRYIFTVNRNNSNESFFAQMAGGMALAQHDRRIVAVNIVGSEDDVQARQNFENQMKIIDFLWKRMGQPNMTLHAGELTLALSPVEPMRSRIRKTIEIGHARRIGHCVSIAWEDNLPGLLREMREKRVAVEICLSSNAGILGVSGDQHPFKLFHEGGIPITLNTDDEGVNRSNLTMEFLRAVRAYGLSYRDLKKLARNSLEYSFLPGDSLYVSGDYSKLRREFANVRNPNWRPNERAQELVAASDKLTMEVRLERAFVRFEEYPGNEPYLSFR